MRGERGGQGIERGEGRVYQGGTVKGRERERIGMLGLKISCNFSVLFFSPPKKYQALIFHHTPKYESPFQTVDK